MENSEVLEDDLDSWEVIPSPYVQQRVSSSARVGEEDLGVFIKEDFYDECANLEVFPVSEHEDLEVSKEESFRASSSSSFSGCSESDDEDLQQTPQSDSLLDVKGWMGKQMRLRIGSLSRRIVSVTSFFWPCAACGTKIWTLNSVTAFMAAVAFMLAYVRMNRLHKRALEESKHRILVLLRQQEQKSSQLLLRIAQMNEMLSARRRIPVIRT